ncbi:uncharacterized protein LOC143039564 isoform X2 [Oratosquilla oratoria]|uniref:uncharacterized protein LOC143039564 isoform X2 n=1 Tax=Oratosquilla oratoria TaxID=337810 RepID=UPI003F7754D9
MDERPPSPAVDTGKLAEEQKTSMSSPSSSADDKTTTPKKLLNPTLNLQLQSVLKRHENELEKKVLEDEKLEENDEQTRKSEEEEEEEENERKRRIKAKIDKLKTEDGVKEHAKKESGSKKEKRQKKENGDDDVKSHSQTEANATETMEKTLTEEGSKDKKGKQKKKKKKSKDDEAKKDHKRKKTKDRGEKSKSQKKERNSKSKSPDKEQSDNKGQQQDMEVKEGKSMETSDKNVIENVNRDKENGKELGSSSPSCPLIPGQSSSSLRTEEETETGKVSARGARSTNDEDAENGEKKREEVSGNKDDQSDPKSKNQSVEKSAKQTELGDDETKNRLSGTTKETDVRDDICERQIENTANKVEKSKEKKPSPERKTESAKEKSNNESVKNSLKNIVEETEDGEEREKDEEGGRPEGTTGKEKEDRDMEEEGVEGVDDSTRRGERTTGYLNMKKKGAFKFWRKYFFVMEDQILKYYKSRQDYQNLKNFKGTLDVFAMENVRERRQGFLKHNHYPFDIQRRSKSTVHLAAPTIEERERWLTLLQGALKKHKAPMRYSYTGLTEGILRTTSEQELRASTLPTASSKSKRDSISSTSSSDTDGRNAQSEEGLNNRASVNRDSHIAVHPRVRFGVALNVKLDDLGSVQLKKARESLSAKNRLVDELPEGKREDEIEDEREVGDAQERFGVKLQPLRSEGSDKIRKISPSTLPRLPREPVLPIQKNSLAAKHGDTSPRKSPTPVHKEVNNVPVIPLSKNMKQFVAKSQEDLDEQSSQEMEESGEKPKENSKKTEEDTKKGKEEQGKEEQKEEEDRESKSLTDRVSSLEEIDNMTVSDKCITVDDKEGNTINGDEEEEEELKSLSHTPLAHKLSHASVKIIHYSETEDLMTDEVSQLDQVSVGEAPTPEKNEGLQEDSFSDVEKTTTSPKSVEVVESEDNRDKGKEEEKSKQNVTGEIPLVSQESVSSPSIVPTPPQSRDHPDLSSSSRRKDAKDPSASPRPSERSRTNTGSSTKSQRSDTDTETSLFRFLIGGRSESKGEISSKNKEDHSQVRERTCSDSSLVQKKRSSFLKIFKKEKSKSDKLSRASVAEESIVTRKFEAGNSCKEQGQSSMKNEELSAKTDLTVTEENKSKNPTSTKRGEDAIPSEQGVKLRIHLENEDLQVRSSYCSIYSHSSVEEDPKPRIPEKSRKRETSPYYDVPQNNRPVSGAVFQMVYTEDDPEEKTPVDGCISQEQIEAILDTKEKRKKSVSQYPGPFLSLPLPGGNNRDSGTSSVSANSTSSDTDRPSFFSSISTESDDPLPTTNFLGSNRSSVDSVTLTESGTLQDKETESNAPMNEIVASGSASTSLRQASDATLGVDLRKRKSNNANRSSFTTSELVAVNEEEETESNSSMMKEGDGIAVENKEGGEEKEVEQTKGEEKDEKEETEEKEENQEKEEKEKEEMVKEEDNEEADEDDYFPTLSLNVEHRPTSGSLKVPLPENTPGLRTSGIVALSKYLEEMKDNGEEETVTGRGISRLGHSAAVEKLKETLQEE